MLRFKNSMRLELEKISSFVTGTYLALFVGSVGMPTHTSKLTDPAPKRLDRQYMLYCPK
ncbi:MAG: hypothetical protein ACC707_17220 [Thiohalomonadales bacterium]